MTQLLVRSQCSLLVAGISDGFATGAYGQFAAKHCGASYARMVHADACLDNRRESQL